MALSTSIGWAAEPFTLERLVETGDPAPDGLTLLTVSPAHLSGPWSLFEAATETGLVLYLRHGSGALHAVARLGDPVPGQPGAVFSEIFGLALAENGRVAFQALSSPPVGSGGYGLYLWEAGVVRRVADWTEPALPGIGLGIQFWPNFEADGSLIFWAASSQTDMGIFRETAPGTFETLLDTSMQVPWEPPGTTIDFIGPSFSANEQGLTFVGSVGDYQLVRWPTGGEIEPLVDGLSTPVPGRPGSTLFVQNWVFGPPAMMGGDVAFRATALPLVVPGWNGIYRTRGNTIEVIADPATPHPISGALFRSSAFFWHPSAGSRHVSFAATSAPLGPRGYFVVSDEGEWTVLAEEGSDLDGRLVTWVADGLDGAWDGERVAVVVGHSGSSAIYVADFGIPVPSPLEIPAAEEVGLIVFVVLLAAAGLATVSRGR